MTERVREWWKSHREQIGLFLGILFVGILCFEAGLFFGKVKTQPSVTIHIPAEPAMAETKAEGVSVLPTAPAITRVLGAEKEQCLYVGSRNSNKYHLPTCAAAKRIKAENIVCFSSPEEAQGRGYLPGCLK
ncbi:MAG: hypothetical protein KBA91_00040 [Candidatus Moranbacteria bacterium]|jgi:hypothetical protein|nr:hypothetical protein [Candidatus Moranbacteria bacterium]